MLVKHSRETEGVDGAPVYFNNKGTGIAFDSHQLSLHSFVHREAVLNTHETVICIFNHIFTGCEIVNTNAE